MKRNKLYLFDATTIRFDFRQTITNRFFEMANLSFASKFKLAIFLTFRHQTKEKRSPSITTTKQKPILLFFFLLSHQHNKATSVRNFVEKETNPKVSTVQFTYKSYDFFYCCCSVSLCWYTTSYLASICLYVKIGAVDVGGVCAFKQIDGTFLLVYIWP